jgi:hypothetical protein
MVLHTDLSSPAGQILCGIPAILYAFLLFPIRIKTFQARPFRRHPWPQLELVYFSKRARFLILSHFVTISIVALHLFLLLVVVPAKDKSIGPLKDNLFVIVVRIVQLISWYMSLHVLANGIARNSRCNLNRSFWFLEFLESIVRLLLGSMCWKPNVRFEKCLPMIKL